MRPCDERGRRQTGELSAGLRFAGDVSVCPGHGARAIRIRASLLAMWSAEFLDGVSVAYFGKADGEREKGGYPRGFHDWSPGAETHGSQASTSDGSIAAAGDQPAGACTRQRRSIL